MHFKIAHESKKSKGKLEIILGLKENEKYFQKQYLGENV